MAIIAPGNPANPIRLRTGRNPTVWNKPDGNVKSPHPRSDGVGSLVAYTTGNTNATRQLHVSLVYIPQRDDNHLGPGRILLIDPRTTQVDANNVDGYNTLPVSQWPLTAGSMLMYDVDWHERIEANAVSVLFDHAGYLLDAPAVFHMDGHSICFGVDKAGSSGDDNKYHILKTEISDDHGKFHQLGSVQSNLKNITTNSNNFVTPTDWQLIDKNANQKVDLNNLIMYIAKPDTGTATSTLHQVMTHGSNDRLLISSSASPTPLMRADVASRDGVNTGVGGAGQIIGSTVDILGGYYLSLEAGEQESRIVFSAKNRVTGTGIDTDDIYTVHVGKLNSVQSNTAHSRLNPLPTDADDNRGIRFTVGNPDPNVDLADQLTKYATDYSPVMGVQVYPPSDYVPLTPLSNPGSSVVNTTTGPNIRTHISKAQYSKFTNTSHNITPIILDNAGWQQGVIDSSAIGTYWIFDEYLDPSPEGALYINIGSTNIEPTPFTLTPKLSVPVPISKTVTFTVNLTTIHSFVRSIDLPINFQLALERLNDKNAEIDTIIDFVPDLIAEYVQRVVDIDTDIIFTPILTNGGVISPPSPLTLVDIPVTINFDVDVNAESGLVPWISTEFHPATKFKMVQMGVADTGWESSMDFDSISLTNFNHLTDTYGNSFSETRPPNGLVYTRENIDTWNPGTWQYDDDFIEFTSAGGVIDVVGQTDILPFQVNKTYLIILNSKDTGTANIDVSSFNNKVHIQKISQVDYTTGQSLAVYSAYSDGNTQDSIVLSDVGQVTRMSMFSVDGTYQFNPIELLDEHNSLDSGIDYGSGTPLSFDITKNNYTDGVITITGHKAASLLSTAHTILLNETDTGNNFRTSMVEIPSTSVLIDWGSQQPTGAITLEVLDRTVIDNSITFAPNLWSPTTVLSLGNIEYQGANQGNVVVVERSPYNPSGEYGLATLPLRTYSTTITKAYTSENDVLMRGAPVSTAVRYMLPYSNNGTYALRLWATYIAEGDIDYAIEDNYFPEWHLVASKDLYPQTAVWNEDEVGYIPNSNDGYNNWYAEIVQLNQNTVEPIIVDMLGVWQRTILWSVNDQPVIMGLNAPNAYISFLHDQDYLQLKAQPFRLDAIIWEYQVIPWYANSPFVVRAPIDYNVPWGVSDAEDKRATMHKPMFKLWPHIFEKEHSIILSKYPLKPFEGNL